MYGGGGNAGSYFIIIIYTAWITAIAIQKITKKTMHGKKTLSSKIIR